MNRCHQALKTYTFHDKIKLQSLNFSKVFYYLFICLQILHNVTALVAALKTLVNKSTM